MFFWGSLVPHQTCRPAKFCYQVNYDYRFFAHSARNSFHCAFFSKNSVSAIPNQETCLMSTKVSAITCFRVGKLPVNWLSLTVMVTGHIDLKPYGRDLRAPKSQSQIATIFCRKRPRHQQTLGNFPSPTTTTESLIWWIIRCYI